MTTTEQSTSMEPSVQTPKTKPKSEKPLSKEGTGRYAQEKIMLGLIMVFVGGVLAMTFVPEPFRGVAMGLIVFLTMLVMFRFN